MFNKDETPPARVAMIFSWPPISGSISHQSVSCEINGIPALFRVPARSRQEKVHQYQ
jgi:hypothetical protein